MATCNNNSTECLLQRIAVAVENTSNAYDWNPLTFGFTVAIGVIALWFAITPILQGLLFPPENRKYDIKAIGDWSQKNEKIWDWATMTFAVTTQTPFLNIQEIAHRNQDESTIISPSVTPPRGMQAQDQAQDQAQGQAQKSGSQTFNRVHDTRFERDSEKGIAVQGANDGDNRGDQRLSIALKSPSAGWLSLLQALGVERAVFKIARTIPTPATTIPSDIPAAVAYGRIESLVILAAVAGCKRIIMDGKYPVCWARGLQLDFRTHTSLGLVAAFSTYGFEPVYRTTTLQDISQAYHHSQGILQYRGKNIENNFVTMNQTIRAKGAYGPVLLPPRMKDDLRGEFNFDHSGGVWLLIGDIPMEVRVFPSVNLQVHAIASALATRDPIWADRSGIPHPTHALGYAAALIKLPGASFSIVESGNYNKATFPDHVRENRKPQFHSWLSDLFCNERPKWPNNLGDKYRSPSNSIIVLATALEICERWLRNPDDFKIAAASTSCDQETILLQLFEIDYWLYKSRTNPEFLKVTRNLFSQGGGFLKLAKCFEGLQLDKCVDTIEAASAERSIGYGNTVIQKIRNVFTRGSLTDWKRGGKYGQFADKVVLGEFHIVEDGLQQFRTKEFPKKICDNFESHANYYLIFRAILYGCLLDTGADNSCILDMNTSQQTVPIL